LLAIAHPSFTKKQVFFRYFKLERVQAFCLHHLTAILPLVVKSSFRKRVGIKTSVFIPSLLTLFVTT
jgi:hypothetical protein